MSDLKERVYEIMKAPTLAPLATITPEGKPWVRYMIATMDPDLTVYMATFGASRKVIHIRANPNVHLIAGVTDPESADSYLQIAGRAEVLVDEETRRARWSEGLFKYFSGPEDPDYAVLRVVPERIELQSASTQPPEVWEAE